jgi:hypothetical protein
MEKNFHQIVDLGTAKFSVSNYKKRNNLLEETQSNIPHSHTATVINHHYFFIEVPKFNQKYFFFFLFLLVIINRTDGWRWMLVAELSYAR